MPKYQLEFHPDAIAETESAQSWYAERNIAAARAFLFELTHAVSKILESPYRWPLYHQGTRRYVFPRFPFSAVYQIKESKIEILTIMHQKRKPGYWATRI